MRRVRIGLSGPGFRGESPWPSTADYPIEFKRQVAQEYLAGETLHGLAKRHEISRNLVRIWVARCEAGDFDVTTVAARHHAGAGGADCCAGAAGRQAGARERVSKGGFAARSPAEKRDYVRHCRPGGLSVAEGCRLMGLARSTYYDEPARPDRSRRRGSSNASRRSAPSGRRYGYRRVTAELHAAGCLVNHKKVMRLMREHGLTVRPRRRFVATTDSDHDGPIFPNLAKDVVPTGRTSSGSPTSPTSPSRSASSIWRPSSMLGRGAWWAMPSAGASMRGSRWRRSEQPSPAGEPPKAASIIPIAARNMLPRTTAPNSRSTV